MTISFVVNPVFLNGGWSPWDTRVGGSEECVIEWSKRLKERGHEVSVYHNGQHGDFGGVHFKERRDYLERQPGVTVNVNYPDLKPLEPTLYWTSLDTQAGRDLSQFQEVCVISEYAKLHTGISHPMVSLLPPGYDSRKIRGSDARIPKTVLYASSPDRGLANLLKVWPTVVAQHPDAYLIVTYGAQLDVPNAICLGEVTEAEMNELYATSDIWCHPASGGELYCMTGIKAQVAQCVPVVFPTMALAETVRAGKFSSPETLATDLIEVLGDEDYKASIRTELSQQTFPDWESTTNLLEEKLRQYT